MKKGENGTEESIKVERNSHPDTSTIIFVLQLQGTSGAPPGIWLKSENKSTGKVLQNMWHNFSRVIASEQNIMDTCQTQWKVLSWC